MKFFRFDKRSGEIEISKQKAARTRVPPLTKRQLIKRVSAELKLPQSEVHAVGANVIIWRVGVPKAATVDNTTDTLTIASHGFATGQTVQVSYTTQPSPLNSSASMFYYVIKIDANSFKLAADPTSANAGTAINITANGTGVYIFKLGSGSLMDTDSVDDYNDGISALIAYPWSANNFCGGVESAAGDSNVWKDVTSGGGCAANPTACHYQDKITNLLWTKTLLTMAAWGNAMDYCKNLTFDGLTGWRLPTQKELTDAYNHGIRSATDTNWISFTDMINNGFWTSTSAAGFTNSVWTVYLNNGTTQTATKADNLNVSCVR